MPAIGFVDGIRVIMEPFEGVYIGGETEELGEGSMMVDVFGAGRGEYVKDWREAMEGWGLQSLKRMLWRVPRIGSGRAHARKGGWMMECGVWSVCRQKVSS